MPKHPPLPADIYPFITLVANKELPLCTGALVAPRAVLTAASCAKAKPSFAFVGAHNFFLDSFRQAPRACRDVCWARRLVACSFGR